MAEHPSVIKRHRQSLKRRERNQRTKSTIKTLIKRVRSAVLNKDKDTALVQIREVNQVLYKAVSKGVLKRNAAARKLSRLARAVTAIKQQA